MMPELQPGRIVGQRYTVKRLVSRGASSALYEAITAPSREILLEVFAPDTSVTSDVESRLAQLAATVNALPAGVVLPIVEAAIDRESGCPFIASEASVTPSLAELVKLCPLENEELVAFVARLGNALDTAHAIGLVHAALDPSRVFVGPAPRCDVRIAGLGTSFLRGHLCDPIWSAPEAYAPTPASDVYSAALLTLFATTGSLPQDPASIVSSVARDIVGTGPPAPALDRRIAGPLSRALAPAAGERYASPGELARAVTESLGSAFVVSSTWNAAAPASASRVQDAPIAAIAPPPLARPVAPPLPPAATSVDALTTPVGSPSPVPEPDRSPVPGLRVLRPKQLVALAGAVLLLSVSGAVIASAALTGKKDPTKAVGSATNASSASDPPIATNAVTQAPVPAPAPAPVAAADPVPAVPEKPPTGGPNATLVVECTPQCSAITVDGEPIESPATVKPGSHVVVVKRGVHTPQTKYVKLTAGHETTLSFIWWKTPPGPPRGGVAPKKPCGKFLQRCD